MKGPLTRSFLMEVVVLTLVAQIVLIVGSIAFILKYATFALSEGYDAPLVETPHEYLETIGGALTIRTGDVVYDLGSGDGRVILYLAKRYPEARFVGIERNPLLVTYSRMKRKACTNASFVRANMFAADFSDATRIYAYLKPKPLNELHTSGKLDGVLLVSRAFTLTNHAPFETIKLSQTPGSHNEHLLHVYRL